MKRFLSLILAMILLLGTFAALPAAAEDTDGTVVEAETDLTATATFVAGNGHTTPYLHDGSTSNYADLGYWADDLSSPAYGIDGSCYVEVDLQTNCTISSITVVNYVAANRCYRWEAYVTDDNTKPISEWTKVGEKADCSPSTEMGYTAALDTPEKGRYVRIYGTYNSANIGYHISEITIMGSFLDEAPELPTYEWPIEMSLTPMFGQIENWGGATCMIVGWGSCAGEDISTIVEKLKTHVYDLQVQIVDETLGQTYTITKYAFHQISIEFFADMFLRILPAYYGIVLYPENAYTVYYTITENGAPRYNCASEVGVFTSENDSFLADGTIIPDEIPYTHEEAETPVEPPVEPPIAEQATPIVIAPIFGSWENWLNSPNNPNGAGAAPGVTQLLVRITDSTGAQIDIDAALTWILTISDGTVSKTINLAPATTALAYNLYRFEPCLAEGENRFVPVNGTEYTVQITVLAEDGSELYKSEAASGFVCTMDPVVPKTECTHKNVTVLEGYDATCTADGLTEGQMCAICGEVLVAQEIIPETGHDFVDNNVNAFVCTKCGLNEGYGGGYDDFAIIEGIGVRNVMAGDTVDVQVLLSSNPGMSFLALTPIYDTSVLTLLSIGNGEVFSDLDHDINLIFSADADTYAEGVLVTFTFLVAEDASAGDYAVELIFRECYNGAYEDVSVEVENANVNIIDFIYGDTNGDREVNGKDVVLLRKYMANYNYDTGACPVAVEAGADANGDGVINGRDVIMLRKYMANYNYETGSSTVVLGPAA